jgi:rRNA-processing protein FCF1
LNEIVFDANFLMMLVEKPSNIIENILRLLDPVILEVPSCVVDELTRISSSKHVKKSKIAALSLEIVKSHMEVIEVPKEGSVDDKIISYARGKGSVFIATMDYELKKRLMRENLKCVTLSNDKLILC